MQSLLPLEELHEITPGSMEYVMSRKSKVSAQATAVSS